jgi:hypothetical protein
LRLYHCRWHGMILKCHLRTTTAGQGLRGNPLEHFAFRWNHLKAKCSRVKSIEHRSRAKPRTLLRTML